MILYYLFHKTNTISCHYNLFYLNSHKLNRLINTLTKAEFEELTLHYTDKGLKVT